MAEFIMKTIRKTASSFVAFVALTLSPLSSAIASSYELKTLTDFGTNPGELSASYFQPQQSNNAIVVLLHGCTQIGEQLAQDIGLLGLAKEHGFSVLIPQQSNSNNITTCFNWFSPQDSDKDQGETLSIKQMIEAVRSKAAVNSSQRANVYIVGLSAGGAMSASLMMHYPNMFEAGAVVAGIPYPCADGLIKAISCMKNGPASQDKLINAAKAALGNDSQLPRLSVWTGDSDKVVNALNAEALANQWQALLTTTNSVKGKLSHQKTKSLQDKVTTKQWLNSDNQPVLEQVTIANLGHGFPVNPAEKFGGAVDKYLLEAPVAAMPKIINFFGIDRK